MSTIKTLENDSNVEDFISAVENEQRRKDAFVLLNMFRECTGEEAKMWGTSIVGFGKYHYKSERSKQEGDWPLVGFSPRKQSLTLYVLNYQEDYSKHLAKLGKHKTSKACVYINKLSDVDLSQLKQLIRLSYKDAKSNLT